MLDGGGGCEVATVEATMVLYNSHEWHGNNVWFLQCRILLLLIAGQWVAEWGHGFPLKNVLVGGLEGRWLMWLEVVSYSTIVTIGEFFLLQQVCLPSTWNVGGFTYSTYYCAKALLDLCCEFSLLSQDFCSNY
jgi:hypothetical protein